jgi:hypothetical protein
MGEMRGGHFHGGLDIRTGGNIGLPVLATADGYISRINMSAGGYGHALYLTHADGKVSVYAHLDKFEKGLAAYTHNKQYEDESYEIRLFPEINEFYFKQGEVIAYSGNSGSSTGPHLHFEIRNSKQRFLNPLEYGFDEIKDELPPILKKIAFTTLDKNARVNGAFGTFGFEVIKVDGNYHIRKPIELSGNIGVLIYHYDNMTGTYSRNGIPELILQIDGDTLFHQVKEAMAFNLNRDILVHMDQSYYYKKRTRFNRLYQADGNQQDIYIKTSTGYFFEEQPYELSVTLRDNHNNFSKLLATINDKKVVYPAVPSFSQYEISENVLQFKSTDTIATVYCSYQEKVVYPYKFRKENAYYLWDLRQGLPDSVVSGSISYYPKFYTSIPPQIEYEFFNSDFDIKTYPKTLFDTLYLRFEKQYDSLDNREVFKFKNGADPLRTNATVTLKPTLTYDSTYQVFSVTGRNKQLKYVGSNQLDNGKFQFKTRQLNTFTLATDSVPPAITPISWNRGYLRLRISDKLSGIKTYRATLDDEFLLMYYDAKRSTLQAYPQNPNTSLRGVFKLVVEDNFGNKTEITRTL